MAELSNLKTIVGRFSDFAKMPAPQFEQIDVNELLRGMMKLYDARLRAEGRAPISLRLELADGELRSPPIAINCGERLSNLVLNAMDAMPDGGTLHVATAKIEDGVRISVADTGPGTHARGMRPAFHSLLHHQASRDGIGIGHRSERGERSSWKDFRGQRTGTRFDVYD